MSDRNRISLVYLLGGWGVSTIFSYCVTHRELNCNQMCFINKTVIANRRFTQRPNFFGIRVVNMAAITLTVVLIFDYYVCKNKMILSLYLILVLLILFQWKVRVMYWKTHLTLYPLRSRGTVTYWRVSSVLFLPYI